MTAVAQEQHGDVRPVPFVGSCFPEEQFAALRDLLVARRGFDLSQYKDRGVKRRVAKRVRARGFHQAGPYLELLVKDEAELDALLGALTVHVSHFFRNPSTFAALETRVLPELFDRSRRLGQAALRLWSVGCSSGEEPYSLALLLEGLSRPEADVSILATDVSAAILERAREGVFDSGRLGEVPPALKERYFVPRGSSYRLAEEIRAKVAFRSHDLLSSEAYPGAELVLCRNVLIYFSREAQERILCRLGDALPSGGYLVLGKAETLLGEARQRFLVESPAERIYRRC
ncbi:MAG: chemotaxis protein CheR [Desulfuromonas sp.]|uniref:CheR family methyltransferase n=1 Tax=Desulfuromonas sp. TaxID=892 RepID=UPI000CAC2D2A|nr:protein-glutamate O-methyltransferase CheR [Desulfuromonas sp.]PLX83517.1 MAG: chemotaxis protein CheR [Desulfuromonas sp.]